MSTPYVSGVGNPPVITALEWKAWYLRLLAWRLGECPVARATTYYFAQAGNDSTGNGSQATPWKSLAKANSVINALAGTAANIALLFNRGDIWRETISRAFAITTPSVGATTVSVSISLSATNVYFYPGQSITFTGGTSESKTVSSYNTATQVITLTVAIANSGHTGITATMPNSLVINASDVTIGSYGAASLAKPLITAFNTPYATSGWSTSTTRSDAYSRTYSRAETGSVGWLRESADYQYPYIKATSLAKCDATPGSWYWASSVIYVHPRDNRNPNNDKVAYESVYPGGFDGIAIGDQTTGASGAGVDGTRIDEIGVAGYGCGPQANAVYDIHSFVGGSSAVVISECDAFYSGKHNIGATSPTGTTGGLVTIYKCRAGGTIDDTPYVVYSANGGQEGLIVESEVYYGYLPPAQSVSNVSELQPYAFGGSSTAFTAHSSNLTAYPVSLIVQYGNVVRPGQFQCNQGFGNVQNPVTWTDLINCRQWCLNERFTARTQTAIDQQFTPFALTTASQASTTVTLAATPSLATQTPQSGQWVQLSGGTTAPEWILISSYAAGVITFASTIVGSARTFAAFNIGCAVTAVGSNKLGNYPACAQGYMPYINCHIEGVVLQSSGPQGGKVFWVMAPTNQLYVNCTFQFDYSQQETMQSPGTSHFDYALTNASVSTNNSQFYNCRLHWKCGPNMTACVDAKAAGSNGGPDATFMTMQNCILSADTPGTLGAFQPAIGNNYTPGTDTLPGNLTYQLNNAYAGATTSSGTGGYDQDTYAVLLGASPPLVYHPAPGSALLSANSQLVSGSYRLEYDADWKARSLTTPAIGPREPDSPINYSPRGRQ